MQFEEAVGLLKKRVSVRRARWRPKSVLALGPGAYIALHYGDDRESAAPIFAPFFPTIADVVADDWEASPLSPPTNAQPVVMASFHHGRDAERRDILAIIRTTASMVDRSFVGSAPPDLAELAPHLHAPFVAAIRLFAEELTKAIETGDYRRSSGDPEEEDRCGPSSR